MASADDDVRYSQRLRRPFLLVLGSAAGAMGALLLTTGPAAAQSLAIPGIGNIDLPRAVAAPEIINAPPITDVPIDNILSAETGGGDAVIAPAARAGFELAITEPTPTAAAQPIEFTFPPLPIDLSFLPGFRPPAPAVAPERTHSDIAIAAARSKLGATYAPGGTGPNAFDCSGLVQWSYGKAGVDLPRTSHQQLATGTPISRNELHPGDMVSFYGGGHSALYSGGGKVIHASTSGAGVVESDMATMPFAGARRY